MHSKVREYIDKDNIYSVLFFQGQSFRKNIKQRSRNYIMIVNKFQRISDWQSFEEEKHNYDLFFFLRQCEQFLFERNRGKCSAQVQAQLKAELT